MTSDDHRPQCDGFDNVDPSQLDETEAARVEELLRQGMDASTYPIGKPLPSETELCELFSVNLATLRKAFERLNALGLLSSRGNLPPLVMATPSENSDRPKATRIGLWLWSAFDDYGSSIAKGVQRVLRKSKFQLYIPHVIGLDWTSLVATEQTFLETAAHDENLAGVILWCIGGARVVPALEELQRVNKPVVFIDRLPPGDLQGDFVGTDNVGSSSAVISHLIKFGHRRIGYVLNTEGVSTIRDRLAGYRQALDDADIEFDPNLVVALGPSGAGDAEMVAEQVVEYLLELSDRPTAVGCANDEIAFRIYTALVNRGLNVPRDISVVGFDGRFQRTVGGGHLTSMAQPFERIGDAAGRLVLERLANGVKFPYRHTLFDAPRVDGDSVGPIERIRPSSGSSQTYLQ